ncbi:hypothetical protein M011DRAFT_481795 [Sporormia fimetaria CBS 119925]|uniref:Protein NO VEIN C-terminal domain-containing protein n=1 Tax=Sporormia fimetaria CBS 119925 TaxID=1340428 RepID=A0A6A6UVL1_9PLEO|nr:hypothetical protein M011DRAFT_481795 [Sporormia fimetaria CBS 119925]
MIVEVATRIASRLLTTGSTWACCLPKSGVLNAEEVFGNSSNERALNIGVAGELFVFKFMEQLKLPGFSVKNWTSSFRTRVSDPPEFCGTGEPEEPEIADIRYMDEDGQFTKYLREATRGRIPIPEEQGAEKFQPIEYLIEVKATTSIKGGTEFHMSGCQKRTMDGFEAVDGVRPKTPYVIWRVHDFLGAEPKFQIYVGGKQLGSQRSGKGDWSVTLRNWRNQARSLFGCIMLG